MIPLALILLLLVALVTLELAATHSWLPKELARKLLHIVAGTAAACAVPLVDNSLILVSIGAAFTLLLYVAVKKSLIPSIDEHHRKSWGIVWFPAVYAMLLLLVPEQQKWIVSFAFLIMAWGDGLAAITGTYWAHSYYNITDDKKSILGSVVFFIITFSILLLLWLPFVQQFFRIDTVGFPPTVANLMYLLVVSGILSLIEASAAKGSDNLFVPLAAGLFLLFITDTSYNDLRLNMQIALLLSLAAGIASYYIRFLTMDGAAYTVLLAFFVFGLGGWGWTLPILVFFIPSSILSKVRRKRNALIEERFDKTGVRDRGQVFANGYAAIPLVIAFSLTGNQLFFLLFVSYIAAACADTWATETGTMRKGRTLHILTWKPVEQGVSGGVSLFGTLGSLAGATLVTLAAYPWLDSVGYGLMVIAAGFSGAIADSILGATVQAQFRCKVCGLPTERLYHCSENTRQVSGFHYINNDVVNFLAGCVACLITLLIMMILS